MNTAVLLLAEDEALLLPNLEDALAEGGYDTLVVDNGIKAIEELEKDVARFRGLITDIRMGAGPSGWDVAHRARELSPTIPVIYMTGDSAADWAANGVPHSVLLQKPFAMAQLVTAISQLITQSNSIPPS
ncbi:response regulator [Devosia albogilva]|uniref:Response regulator n=1 Tax=Devosia albogilva TaxID=429726 RepID=A0ABW5QFQ2_9HYPH